MGEIIMNLKEETKKSELIYDGEVLHVYKDNVILPNGENGTREVIRHVGAVGIVALNDENEVILERQFRYPLNREIVEIPAGKLNDKTENRLEAAKREFQEETGYTAKNWVYLGEYAPAAAYTDEIITLYLATDLTRGEQNFDDDEFLEIFFAPLEDVLNNCMNSLISDGKTIAAISRACYYLDSQKEK